MNKVKPILNYKESYDMQVVNSYRFAEKVKPFKITVDTTKSGATASNQVILPIVGTDIRVKTIEHDTTTSGNITLTFSVGGTYEIEIYEPIKMEYNTTADRSKLISINDWGEGKWSLLIGAFWLCSNMIVLADVPPNLSECNNTSAMFYGCSKITEVGISNWDFSTVQKANQMFYGCALYDEDITIRSNALISNYEMLRNCYVYDSIVDLSNCPNITNSSAMFSGCRELNTKPLMDTSKNKNFTMFFYDCRKMTFDVNWLDTSSAETTAGMFQNCYLFNQPVNHFDMSKNKNMSNMFMDARIFNQPLSNWNTSQVSTFSSMFQNAYKFNQNLTTFNFTSISATGLNSFLYNAREFNGTIPTLPAAITSLYRTFAGCWVFNQNITCNSTTLTTLFEFLRDCKVFNSTISLANTSNVTTMEKMLNGCLVYNRSDLANMNVSSVTNMVGICEYTSLGSTNYDVILVAFAAQALQSDVNAGFGTAKYTDTGQTAKQSIENTFNWIFTDGGHV